MLSLIIIFTNLSNDLDIAMIPLREEIFLISVKISYIAQIGHPSNLHKASVCVKISLLTVNGS